MSDKTKEFQEGVMEALKALEKRELYESRGFLGFGNCPSCGCALKGRSNDSCVLVGVYCPKCTQK